MNRSLVLRWIVDRPLTNDQHRRLMGALFGAGFAFVYAAISQTINSISIPGVPVYQSFFGAALNVVVLTVFGGALGLLTAWPASAAHGVLWSTLLCGALFQVYVLWQGSESYEGLIKLIVPFLLFLPICGLLAVPIALFRWVLNKQEEAQQLALPLWMRARIPLLLVIVIAFLASTWLYPPEGREVMARTHALLQSGLQATNATSLPEPLQSDRVDRFTERASTNYGLYWEKEDLTRFAIARPNEIPEYKMSVVVARFDNGWVLACLYPLVDAEPRCKSYDSVP